MASTDYDIITVGGGLAASSLAKIMATAGHRVLILERETTFRDRVRGEYMNPWGLAEAKALGIHDTLMAAGAHEVPKFEFRVGPPREPIDFTESTRDQLPALSFFHPAAQEALLQSAADAGVEVRRGVSVTDVHRGSPPSVDLRDGDTTSTLTAQLIVGDRGHQAA